jgi:hypothetical protein
MERREVGEETEGKLDRVFWRKSGNEKCDSILGPRSGRKTANIQYPILNIQS